MNIRTALTLSTTAALTLATFAGTSASVFADDGLPLQNVTLYRSGVGFFEHGGMIEGDQTISLRFDADKVNDILKSLVLLDFDGGSVDAVRYSSKEPLHRRLESFGINIADNPSLHELLGRLRGVDLQVVTAEGPVTGTVLGVELRPSAAPGTETVSNLPYLTLITNGGIRTISMTTISTFEILDEKLAEELRAALSTLAQHRAERTAEVDLVFNGAGDRHVAVGYVHEMPVWKTTYRLVLPDATNASPRLQGWAIIENTTDQDWEDVTLSLAAGRPIGFTMDLQTPLFSPRQNVAVPVLANVGPRVYEQGQFDYSKLGGKFEAKEQDELRQNMKSRRVAGSRSMDYDRAEEAQLGDISLRSGAFASIQGGVSAYSPAAMATAGEVGEQFHYELDAPISIERQKSAMAPIINADIEGRRVSIYNHVFNAKNPMRGVELTNDSGLHLMPGPITVFDGSYSGDAQIGHTSRGDKRLLSYAVDLDMRCSKKDSNRDHITKVIIRDGLIRVRHVGEQTATYTLGNHDGTRERTVLVEHPKQGGWKLKDTEKPYETTEQLYRFEVDVAPDDESELKVTSERVYHEQFAMTSMALETLLSYSKNGTASRDVVDAVRKAAEIQGRINMLKGTIAELDRERDEISRDQSRIRDNMGRISRDTDLYKRYMTKMNAQETRLEQMIEEREIAVKKLGATERELSAYLNDLDID